MLYIDVTRLYHTFRRGNHPTGVDRVSLAYVRQFANISCAVIRTSSQWLFFSQKKSSHLFNKLLQQKPIKLPLKIFRHCYKKQTDGNDYLLHTAHNGLEDPKFLEQLKKHKLKGIYFLHDLIPINYPEYCRAGSDEQHQQRLLTMSKGELVICNSYDVFDGFLAYCKRFNLNPPKTIWAHLGVNHLNKYKVPKPILTDVISKYPFFLMIGTIEGRKNHWLILNVWRELADLLGEQCPKLILIGKRGWECEQIFAMLDRSVKLKQYVIELNECQDEEMLYLLNHTRALLFPSNAEGFGLPLVEALMMKVPVIASDIAIFKEISFGAVELVSVIDGVAWQDKIIQYASPNSQIRNNQLTKITQIQHKLPTWEKHFSVASPHINTLIDN